MPQVLQPNLVSSNALPVGPSVIPVEFVFAQPAWSSPGEELSCTVGFRECPPPGDEDRLSTAVALRTSTGRRALRVKCDDERVVHVMRLVTFVEVADLVASPLRLSVSARHEAVLSNGDRVLLLDDRGWSESIFTTEGSAPPDIWSSLSAGEIGDTARVVVGPDEPFDGYSQERMESNHWDTLAAVLQREGVDIEGTALSELPHEVVLGEELLARLCGGNSSL